MIKEDDPRRAALLAELQEARDEYARTTALILEPVEDDRVAAVAIEMGLRCDMVRSVSIGLRASVAVY
jgi:hypothetical protein